MNISFEKDCQNLAMQLGAHLQQRRWRCAVAESCTGGGLGAAITACSGSSQWFDGGVITYSNQAKQTFLGVSSRTLAQYGAVCEETACEMAEGIKRLSGVEMTAAITGIAGPTGGTSEKPVGTVWIAWSIIHHPTEAQHFLFEGNRLAVRQQAIRAALRGLVKFSE